MKYNIVVKKDNTCIDSLSIYKIHCKFSVFLINTTYFYNQKNTVRLNYSVVYCKNHNSPCICAFWNATLQQFPSRDGIYFSSPWIWAGLIICFGQQIERKWQCVSVKLRPQLALHASTCSLRPLPGCVCTS